MKKELLDKLITEEVLKTSGFINIDEKDVKNILQKSAFVDGSKSIGHPSELKKLIENAVAKIESKHKLMSKCALLVI